MNSSTRNRITYTVVPALLVGIFILSLVLFGAFKCSNGGVAPKVYSYAISNSIIKDDSTLESDNVTFIYESEAEKQHQKIVFTADNEASLGVYNNVNSYIYGGKNIKFTFSLTDENIKISSVVIDFVKGYKEDACENPPSIAEDQYSRLLTEDHKYIVSFNNTELLYIYKIAFQYTV